MAYSQRHRELRFGCLETGWRFLMRSPSQALRPFVRELHGYSESGMQATIRTEVPIAGYPVIFIFGPGFTAHDSAANEPRRQLANSFVAGLHKGPAFIGSLGNSICMQANLTPHGARRLFGCDLDELADTIIDLDQLLGRPTAQLEAKLHGTGDWDVRFDILERFLLDRIWRHNDSHPIALEGSRLMSLSRGTIEIGAVARRLDCSRKHLNDLFKREIGMSAKSYGRLCRFEHASTRVRQEPDSPLTSIAHDCGYADQSHFNRDFLAFAGETPGAFRMRETTIEFPMSAEHR